MKKALIIELEKLRVSHFSRTKMRADLFHLIFECSVLLQSWNLWKDDRAQKLLDKM